MPFLLLYTWSPIPASSQALFNPDKIPGNSGSIECGPRRGTPGGLFGPSRPCRCVWMEICESTGVRSRSCRTWCSRFWVSFRRPQTPMTLSERNGLERVSSEIDAVIEVSGCHRADDSTFERMFIFERAKVLAARNQRHYLTVRIAR